MPTARAPWTPRRVIRLTTDDGYAATCCTGLCEQGKKCPLHRPASDNVPPAPALAARLIDAACWLLGIGSLGALVTACVRSSDLFR